MFLKCWQQTPISKSKVNSKIQISHSFWKTKQNKKKKAAPLVSWSNNCPGLIFSFHCRQRGLFVPVCPRPHPSLLPPQPWGYIYAILILMGEKCSPNPRLYPKWEYPRKTKTAIATCFLYLATSFLYMITLSSLGNWVCNPGLYLFSDHDRHCDYSTQGNK